MGTGQWTDTYGTLTYTLGSSGGERLHKLTIPEMPTHNHNFNARTEGFQGGGFNVYRPGGSGWTTDNAGGDQAHNNMMPYISVHWIIKT